MENKKDFFENLSSFVVKYKGIVLISWIIITIIGGIGAFNVDKVLHGEGSFVKSSESYKQSQLIENEFPKQFNKNMIITIKSNEHTIDSPKFSEVVKKIEDYLYKMNEVGGVYDFKLDPSLASKDKKSTFIVIGLKDLSQEISSDSAHIIGESIKRMNFPSGFDIHITGTAVIVKDMSEISGQDSARAEKRIIPLVIIILIIVFGALISAIMPVIVAFMSIIITLGCLFLIGHYFELAIFCKAITSMMGLGVGIDYCLFMVSRFREELTRNKTVEEAARKTGAIAGKAIFYSGFAVSVGMLALLIPDLPLTRSVGFSGFLVVTIAIFLSLTLLPALFAILGENINSPRFISKYVDYSSTQRNFWINWSKTVMKKPITFFTLGLTSLIILSGFTFGIKLWNSSVLLMPENLDSRKGFVEMLNIDPSRKFSPIGISFETNDDSSIYERKNIEQIYELSKKVLDKEKIDRVIGIVNPASNLTMDEYQNLYNNTLLLEKLGMAEQNPFVSSDLKKTIIWAFHKDDEDSTADWAMVRELRELRDKNISTNMNILIGGGGSTNVDFENAVYEYFPMIVILIIIATYIIMFSLLGSITLPIKAIFMNVISVTASYGWLTLVFVYGFGTKLLGITQIPGALLIITPLVLFCIIFGLSMDYEIFMMSRIKEEYEKSGDTDYAVSMGLEKTGAIITSAALIMIVVFSAFAFSKIILVQELGVGLATAVFIDATVIRLMLVPSILKILGKWSWWLPEGIRSKMKFVKIEH